jgi:hypothetical protein
MKHNSAYTLTNKGELINNMSNQELGKLKHTSRGFELIEFKDIYDEECSLQQSSLAIYNPPGSSAIWLGVDDNNARMHLDQAKVRQLILHLQNWLDTGSLNPDKSK